MFASCGANESESESSTVNFARREVSTIKIDNLEVMTEDLERTYTWGDAMKACADLGDGWRLPTKDELNLLYENKEKIGGFAGNYYWSSTEHGININEAWNHGFSNGFPNDALFSTSKSKSKYVRAVRAF